MKDSITKKIVRNTISYIKLLPYEVKGLWAILPVLVSLMVGLPISARLSLTLIQGISIILSTYVGLNILILLFFIAKWVLFVIIEKLEKWSNIENK